MGKVYSWVKKWWIVCLIAILFGIVLFGYWWYTRTVTGLFIVLLQVGITSTTTIFVGVLAKNMSFKQWQINQKQQNEQMLQQLINELIVGQATAITHLGSDNPVIVAAAITEMTSVIKRWDKLSCEKKINRDDGLRHVQELVNLIFTSKLMETEEVNHARSNTIRDLSLSMRSLCAKDISFNNGYISRANLSGIKLEKVNLANSNLVKTDFSEATARGANLANASLKDADLSGTNLAHANLFQANLTGITQMKKKTETQKLSLGNIMFMIPRPLDTAPNGQRLNLEGADLRGAILRNADLRNANLSSAKLQGTDLTGANLTGANLDNAILYSTTVTNAKFQDVRMKNAQIWFIDFEGVNLKNSDLTGASLYFTYFEHANLVNVNISHANIDDVRWENAILNGANLVGSKLNTLTPETDGEATLGRALLLPPVSFTNTSNI